MENIIQRVSGILSQLSFISSDILRLAFAGIVLLALFFIISALLSIGSKIRGLTKKLLFTAIKIAKMDWISEENVEELNATLAFLPEEVNDGWGRFLEQRAGYPSDYMKEKNILDENAYTTKNTAGGIFFKIFGFMSVAFIAVLSVFMSAEDAANLGFKDFFDNFTVVGSLVGSIVLPILFFIIFDIIISMIYRKQKRRLQLVYKTFLDNLDEKVIISADKEEEFVSDSLDEITKNIEEVISMRMDKDDMVEVLTTPEIKEYEINKQIGLNEIRNEETMPLYTSEEAETDENATAISAEEQKSYLAILIQIVEDAINDPMVKLEDLEQIAELIYSNLETFENPVDKAVLDECLQKLADIFYAKK